MEYKLISEGFAFSQKKAKTRLVDRVNDAIRKGWEPLGGVAVTSNSFVQTVVKRRGH
ncbi:DUF1737 domain-containing protein [Pelagicoccus mobilis]|uniref:DUF1737 domain-containing protein n=1 Tax=Pelagicoccus mobilis TaxID=415221 RepID=A0A934S0D7_9BACT|nr:DUF1737 domain-containing protein [Pelagicoccus mobilis]MBK1878684.1 DUF1737 domain-containing protein [Pelagicoccus mobilis]